MEDSTPATSAGLTEGKNCFRSVSNIQGLSKTLVISSCHAVKHPRPGIKPC